MKTPLLRRIFLSVLVTMSLLAVHGQQVQKRAPASCYFDEVMLDQIKKNPAVQERINERDRMINEYIENQNEGSGSEKSLSANLIIPVVVYVVHEYGPENITDLQVTSQINALNDYFDAYGIQFCLATKKGTQNLTSISTPSGITSTTPGIFHYGNATLTNHNVSQQTALTAIASTLPADQYLRIWVVKGITSNTLPPGQKILGYSMLPEFAASATDGIVMSYDAFGDVATCSCSTLEPYSQLGRIMVHEAGHYLGLYHTFNGGCQGMTASNCATSGDRVCDTPPVNAPNSGCPSSTWNTCSESPNFPDDIHNYMDYVSESCMTGFTNGQNTRMLAQINLFRANLVSSGNLTYTGVSCNGGLLSDFTASNYSPCVNSSITFTAIPSPGATYTWDFGDGTTGSGVTVSHTYTGVYQPANVVLTITNGTNSVSATRMVFVEACEPINQDQGNWYFGQRGGMDFSSGAPVYDNGAFINANHIDEADAVQSNDQGDLLFYTNGIEVWNANHATINVGSPLKSGLSAHRGALIVKNPANANQYYLFTKDQGRFSLDQTLTIPDSNGFRYSIVQINAGMASMTASWNVAITPPAIHGYDLGYDNAMLGGEGVTAVKSCNGYWIITTGKKGSQYFITVYSLTSSGLAFHSQIVSPYTTNQQALEVSRDGSKIAIGSGTNGSLQTTGLTVYDFNVFTGILSNPLALNSFKSFGFSFSPNSELLYCSSWSNSNLYQYDLTDPSPATSGIMVTASVYPACEMQLGPDDKLYLSSGTTFVQVVHQPNVRSTTATPNACLYTPNGPQMQTQLTHSMPNMIDATGNSVFSNELFVTQISCLMYAFDNTLCSNTFSWNFGDPASGAANTSTLQNPTHTFSAPGTYTITVTGGGTTLTTTVQIGTSSTISGSPTICLSTNATGNYATNLQAGQTALWSVSGGGIAGLNNQSDVMVAWTSLPGTVTLTVTDNTTGCTSTSTFVVTEYCCTCDLDPTMIFDVNNELCEVNFGAQHGGSSCLGNVLYAWNLDGMTAYGSNVTYPLATPGTHNVCLTVTANANGQLCSKQICEVFETDCEQPCECTLAPTFDLSLDKQTCAYTFHGVSGGSDCLEFVEYFWDFGDGTIAFDQAPQHVFATAGTYAVCLTVTVRDDNGDILCQEKICKEVEANCEGECPCNLKPVFDYSLEDDENCIYRFEGNSGDPDCSENVEYLWDFGDGTAGSGQSPQHVFASTGTFNVCLTVIVRNNKGLILCQETLCKRIEVTCKGDCECKLKPEFTYSVDEKDCIYTFEGVSGGPDCLQFVEYYWDFGDGTTSMGQTAGHVYSSTGTYEVCLTVIVRNDKGDILCEDKSCRIIEVRCTGGCDCQLDPVYTMTQIGTCEFLFTGFSGSSCVNIDEIKWFVNGDGVASGQLFTFQFEVNQSYTICMVVIGTLNNGEKCEKEYCQEFFYTDCYPFGNKAAIEVEDSPGVSLYPNPANDQFQLKFADASSKDVEVTLKSMDGKVIGHTTYPRVEGTNELTVQLPATLSNGFIMIEVKTGNQVYMEKLMILK